MEAFKGTYTRTSADQYEEFLKALDVSYLLRKAATVSNPSLEITESGGVWSIRTATTLKSMELKFKVTWATKQIGLSSPDAKECCYNCRCSWERSSRRRRLTAGT